MPPIRPRLRRPWSTSLSSYSRDHDFNHANNLLTASRLSPEDDELATRTIYVGNLDPELNEQDLYEQFKQFGRIESVFVKRVPKTRPKSFAFIRFDNLLIAFAAKSAMHMQKVGAYPIVIGYSKLSPTSRIWIGNLCPQVSTSQLERELDRFGAISKLIRFRADCEAYCQFESLSAAEDAKKHLTGFRFSDDTLRLVIDYDEPEHLDHDETGFTDCYVKREVLSANDHIKPLRSPNINDNKSSVFNFDF